MSDKPNSVALGAFIVGALLIGISAVLFVVGSGFGSRDTIVMVFDGSVKGLNVGAPVALRGVQVGQVTDISVILDADNLDFIMIVEADFHEGRVTRQGHTTGDVTEELIKRGLRAQLNTQSLLTGLLYVQLDFHPGSEMVLRKIDSPYTQFPTVPTDLERIARKLESLDFSKFADNLESAVTGLDKLINNKSLQGLPADLHATLLSVTTLSDQMQQELARSMPKVDKVLDGAAVTVATANKELPEFSQQLKDNLTVLYGAVKSFEQAMVNIDGLVSPDSATTYQLNQALREMTMAGREIQLLARTLTEQPEALLRGRSGDN